MTLVIVGVAAWLPVRSRALAAAEPSVTQRPLTPAGAPALSSNAQLRQVVEKFVTLNPNGVKLLVDRQVVEQRKLPLPTRAFDLYELTIGGDPAKGITDQDVDHLAGGRSAQVIWLNNAPITRLVGLQSHTGLLRLALEGTAIKDESLKALSGMKALLDLNLNSTTITGTGLTSLAGCTSLSFLSLVSTSVQDAHLAPLAQLRNLTRLQLGNTKVKGPGLSHLAGLGKLAHLALDGLNLEANALDAISRSRSITTLDLNATKLETTHLDRIGLMANLEGLALDNATIGGKPLADGDLARLAALAKLKTLNLNHTAVTGTGLTALAKARNLDALAVEDTTALTDEGLLVAIRTFPALTQIFLGGKVTETSIPSLGQLRKLRFLRLNGPNLGDAAVAALPSLRTLEVLELNAPHTTSACAAALSRQPGLTRLSISNTALNDDAIPHLGRIKTLRELSLGTAPISAAGLDALKKALPACAITK